MMPEKIDKKSLWYLAIVFVIAILVCVGFFYYLSLMSKIEIEEKISEDREYIYQNKVTSECSSETCWINDEGKKECTATFGKCQWIDDNGTWKDFIDVVNVTFDYSSGDIIYFYKEDYSVTARLFLVLDISQSVCETEGWDWRDQDNSCFLWWDKAKKFMEANGIDYDVIIAKYPDRYKYALSLTKIPQNYQDRMLYVGLRLEKAKGLKWEDLNKQESSLTIKNKISLGFDDLIENGFTYKLYDEKTILIANVSNKENLWLDPVAGPATETSDGEIYGNASGYSTAHDTSYDYSTINNRMSIGQDYEAGECTGTVMSCEELNMQGDEWDYDDCVTNPDCYWEGCSGTMPCDNFDDDSYFCNYVGCSWDGCTGTAYACELSWGARDFCELKSGCTWVACEGTAATCDSWDNNYGGCLGHDGCSWDGCSGTATDCDYFWSWTSCTGQDGCEWIESGYGDYCDGTPDSCDSFDEYEFGCLGQSGCSWNGCSGTATSCDSYDDDWASGLKWYCEAHYGCSWPGCIGTPDSCDSFGDDSYFCNYVGCSWDGCTGTDISCSVFDDYADDCVYFGCSWVGCAGTAVLCSDYTDESSCNSAPGQNDCNWEEGDYWVNRGYLSFDTSSIPDDAVITEVTLSMKRTIYDYSDTDFDIEIWKFNWSEPITSSNREVNYDASGAVYDAVWKNTADLLMPDVYYNSSSLDTSWINLIGDTKYQLRSSRDVSATEPTDSEYLELHSADSMGHDPILNITYTVNAAPTWDSIEVTPDPANGGSPITVTAYGEDDLEHDTLAIYCDESTNPSSDSGHHDVCSGTGFTSPYDISCTGTAPTSNTSHTVYCKLYDGTDYSTEKQDSYTANQLPDKPTGLNESWGCCGGTPQVALRTCLILGWSYSDPDGDPQAGYEVWIDKTSNFSSPKFNHVVNLGSPFYTVDLTADDEGDWLDPPPLPGGLVWANTYWWKVKVKDSNDGWSDFSDPKSFTLPNHASPKVDFTPNPINPRTGEVVAFIDGSTIDGSNGSKCYLSDDSDYDCKDEFEITGENDISYEWDFDYEPTEGFTVDDTFEGDTTHTYPETGKHTVRLQVTDGGVGLGPGMCYKEKTIGSLLPTWKEITPF